MLSYEWDEGEALSARGDESTGLISERRNHTLLRPIYMNAVEVGYAYTQCDKDKRLNVRGVTIALWYFISKGHQTVALLPYCFKIYPDKSTYWPELMALFKMNLIEFTPGYGSEKYTEVNRILANRAADTGGCIVARSQMHDIIEERPTLGGTVEKRLLMPSFNHNDIIFPVDGPLGRCGPSLQSTLECPLADPDWPRCSIQQMVLRDQRYWLTKLCTLVPDQVAWRSLLHAVMSFKPSIPLPAEEPPPRCSTHAHTNICRPETNPIDAKEYSCSRGFNKLFGHEQPLELYRSHLPGLMSRKYKKSREDFLPEYLRSAENFLFAEEHSTVAEKSLLDQVSSTYPAEYIGYSTTSDAIRVVGMHPRVRVVGRLVDFALVEPDETDDDKPGEDILNYAEFVDLLKAAKARSQNVPGVDGRGENRTDLSDASATLHTNSTTLNNTMETWDYEKWTKSVREIYSDNVAGLLVHADAIFTKMKTEDVFV
ncbi:unnamed protein product [Angiostrongylus costaricensis]|uniref:RNase_Zc3h12a domain-containing protein n=1 Tax=Angiostrongylus costaricensis TaxID=334426 RepID=A0A158PIE3_ANGCS|nr:unnamed protein product [Angiostrongylus costaricensis]